MASLARLCAYAASEAMARPLPIARLSNPHIVPLLLYGTFLDLPVLGIYEMASSPCLVALVVT
jgi:hypothetical protein